MEQNLKPLPITGFCILFALSCGCSSTTLTLKEKLESGNPYLQTAALNAIIEREGQVSADLLPLLAECLYERFPKVGVRAARALGAVGKPALPALRMALTHTDESIRWKAALGLYEAGPEAAGAVPDLIKALEGEPPLLRMYAAMALGNTGERATAVPALKEALNDTDSRVRSAASMTLRSLGETAP